MAERTWTSLIAEPGSLTQQHYWPFSTRPHWQPRGELDYASILSKFYIPNETRHLNQAAVAGLLGTSGEERSRASTVEAEAAYRELSLMQQRQEFLVGLLDPEALN